MGSTTLRVGLTLACATLASCAMLLGFDELEERVGTDAASGDDAGGVDASSDAGSDAARPPSSLCPQTWVPPTAEPGTETWVFALEALRLIPSAADPQGLDLDCQTTDSLETSSCTVNLTTDEQAFRNGIRDLDGGVDNASKGPLAALGGSLGLSPDALEQSVRAGRTGMLFRVVNANAHDSPAVAVTAFPAGRVRGDGGACDAGADSPRVAVREVLDARATSFEDEWCVDEDYTKLVDGALPLGSVRGWIRDGWLYAHFPELVVPVLDDRERARIAHAHLREAYLVARIVGEDGERRLENAVLAGRWPMTDALAESFSITSDKGDDGRCRIDPGLVDSALRSFCPVRDIGVPPRPERCSAVSVGFAFSAYAVETPGQPGFLSSYEDQCDHRVYVAGDVGDASDGSELFHCPGDVD